MEINKKSSSFQKAFIPIAIGTGSVMVRNSNHFVEELIEIGGFSKILEESN